MPLDPKNLAAQLAHRATGNPPSTLPASAVSNFFPGLEFDFRNVWRRLFEGLELHEARLLVVSVTPGGPAAVQGVSSEQLLIEVNGQPTFAARTSPAGAPAGAIALEWSNALADAARSAGTVSCRFQRPDGSTFLATLAVRAIFDGAAVSRELAEPGELTQSLCSPWQADYRECGCFYWSASRPDYVNVDVPAGGAAEGHSWMHRDRDSTTPKGYVPDGSSAAPLVTYEDLYRAWEQHLRFIIGGRDEAR